MLFSLLSQRPYVWLGGNSSGLKLASTCVRDMRGEPLQDVFESRYRSVCTIDTLIIRVCRSINVHANRMNDARSSGQLWSKSVVFYLRSISQTRICETTSVLFTRDTGKNVFAANGIAVCTWKHNKSNGDGDVPRHAGSDKEIFANGALLSFPVMRHEYNGRELIERCIFTGNSISCLWKSRDLEKGENGTGISRPAFLLTQIFLFIYTRYPTIESFCFAWSYFTSEKNYTRAHTSCHEKSFFAFIHLEICVLCACVCVWN